MPQQSGLLVADKLKDLAAEKRETQRQAELAEFSLRFYPTSVAGHKGKEIS